MKAFMRIRRFFLFMWLHTLARAWYFLLAFFRSVFTWKSKLSLPSRFTPSNLTLSLFKISVLEIFISTGVIELVKRWHFFAFATKLLVENHWEAKWIQTGMNFILVENLTSVFSQLFTCVHMNWGEMKLKTVWISYRSFWPKWNVKPAWDFNAHVRLKLSAGMDFIWVTLTEMKFHFGW